MSINHYTPPRNKVVVCTVFLIQLPLLVMGFLIGVIVEGVWKGIEYGIDILNK